MDRNEYEAILNLAIEAEIDAQNFYADLSAKANSAHLKEMFADFVEEEKKHEKILKGFQAKETGHIHFKEIPDFKVSETVEKPKVSGEMRPADAIAIAMKNEEEAMNHYKQLADACIDTEQKRVFQELAAMEMEHKNRMEKAFVDIGYPEVW